LSVDEEDDTGVGRARPVVVGREDSLRQRFDTLRLIDGEELKAGIPDIASGWRRLGLLCAVSSGLSLVHKVVGDGRANGPTGGDTTGRAGSSRHHRPSREVPIALAPALNPPRRIRGG